MSYFKSIFKRWMGAPDHRITYEPPPTGGYQRGEDDPPQDGVSGSSPPPSYHTGPRPEGQIAPHELKMQQEEVLKQAQDRAEQEELMIAIGMSRSLQEERLRMTQEEEDIMAAAAMVMPSPAAADKAEKLSLKYWQEGNLTSEDQICDGFFDVNGEFPELGPGEIFPDFQFLSQFEPEVEDMREVVVVNGEKDKILGRVEQLATDAFFAACPRGMVAGARAVARVVAQHMGGPAASDKELFEAWASASTQLKWENNPSGRGGLLVPLGSISPGLSRHRALLFKYVADQLCIPCQLLRQRSNGFSEVFQSMIILEIEGKELLLDLMRQPGNVTTPEEHFEAEASTSAEVGWTYWPMDACQGSPTPVRSIPLVSDRVWRGGAGRPGFEDIGEDDSLSTTSAGEHDGPVELSHIDLARMTGDPRCVPPLPAKQQSHQERNAGSAAAPTVQPSLSAVRVPRKRQDSYDLIDLRSPNPLFVTHSPFKHSQSAPSMEGGESRLQPTVRPLSPLRNRSPTGDVVSCHHAADPQLPQVVTARRTRELLHANEDQSEQGHTDLPIDTLAHDETSSSDSGDDEFGLEESTPGRRVWDPITDCLIDMAEVQMQSRLGVGSYGEVHRAEWQGTEVAIKQFLEQEMTDAVMQEFLQEVRIMKDLRHPNIVQFMGATWRPRGIVMQYMHRGSLFRLLHRNPKGKRLHLHRRLRMALDIALGMRYLHSRKPMIVHRDLKSPNLLVARDWTVRLCDFGLSKLKSNTFLSTKSSGGTPEWMAPEVLRNEPANEKSDVYSFAVIMWELMFYQEPWQGTRPMQVVFAVGSNNQRLPMPEETPLNSLIEDCWAALPSHRPSFDEIYERLRVLQRPINQNFEGEGSAGAGPSQLPSADAE